MYWISVHTFGALLQFQYHSCEEIVYFSRDFSTIIICIHHNEVTSGQQVLSRCFHCARLESKYWNSVSTFGALLHFQYHSCEEIVYFSRDCSTTSFNFSNIPKSRRTSWSHSDAFIEHLLARCDFIMMDAYNDSTKIPWKVDYLFTAVVLKLKKCPKSVYWNSVHRFKSCTMKASLWLQLVRRYFGLLDKLNESSTKIPWKVDYLFTSGVLKMKMCLISLHFQYPSCEEVVYFSRDFSTTFIQYIQHTEVKANQLKSYRCFHCARLESMYWNSVSTYEAHGYWISVHRFKSCTMKASELQDLNRCTEIQYPLMRHIFIFRTTAVKR